MAEQTVSSIIESPLDERDQHVGEIYSSFSNLRLYDVEATCTFTNEPMVG